MKPDKKTAFDFNHMPPKDLLVKSTWVYGLMMVVGLLAMAFGHETLATALGFERTAVENGRLAVIGLLGAGLLQILSFFFEDWFVSYRDLKGVVMRILGPLSVPMACYLALMTAFGEELVFRGAIQPVAGLLVTSFLFGLMHVGPGGLLSAWSLWAMIAGALLGWMFDETKSLWPSILAHFVVNFISIMSLRRLYRSWVQAQKEASDPGAMVQKKSDVPV